MALGRIGLTDVRTLIKLMCLTAAGRIQSPVDGDEEDNRFYHAYSGRVGPSAFSNLPYDIPTCTKLQHLGKAVEVLTNSDTSAAKLVLEMCTRVREFENVHYMY